VFISSAVLVCSLFCVVSCVFCLVLYSGVCVTNRSVQKELVSESCYVIQNSCTMIRIVIMYEKICVVSLCFNHLSKHQYLHDTW
jgi:hypothetical protein